LKIFASWTLSVAWCFKINKAVKNTMNSQIKHYCLGEGSIPHTAFSLLFIHLLLLLISKHPVMDKVQEANILKWYLLSSETYMRGGTTVMPPIFFSEILTSSTIKFIHAKGTSFKKPRLFFHILLHYHHTFSTFA
jgi:hypothetical protein